MAQDRKHLIQRNGTWYLNFKVPKTCGLPIAGYHVQQSLRTTSYRIAAAKRDRIVKPLLATTGAHEALAELVRLICSESDESRNLVAQLAAECAVEQIAGIRSAFLDRVTLSEMLDRYHAYLANGNASAPSSLKKYRGSFDVLCWALGAKTDAQAITNKQVATARDRLLALPRAYFIRSPENRVETPKPGEPTMAPKTVRDHFVNLSSAYFWAIGDGMIHCRNPVQGVKIKQSEPIPKNCPNLLQVEALTSLPRTTAAVGDLEWRTIPLIARYTAARFQEIAGLHVDDLEEVGGLLCIRLGHHNKKLKTVQSQRTIPIADTLRPVILDALKKRRGGGRLFPHAGDSRDGTNLGKTLNKFYNQGAKKVGPFSFHCLRMYANTRMEEGGIPEVDRNRIMGQKYRGTIGAYTPQDLRRYYKAVNVIAEMEDRERATLAG